MDNTEYRKNLCDYIENYQHESINSNTLGKNGEDKKSFIIDKYNKKINSVIEEDTEEENEINERKNSRLTSQFTQFNINDRRDDDKIV